MAEIEKKVRAKIRGEGIAEESSENEDKEEK